MTTVANVQDTAQKKIISPTQINMYTKCGEQYRRRYVLGERIPPGISLIKGISVHKGAELNFTQKIESRVDLKTDEVVDCSVATMEGTIKHEGLNLSEEEQGRGKDIVVGEAKDSTVRMAKLFMEGGKDSPAVAPKYQPAEVETKQTIEIDGSSHNLSGVLDLIDDQGRIVDLKTSMKSKNQNEVDTSGQLTFYSMLYRAKFKKDPKSLIIENLVDSKTPKINTFETKRDMGDYEAMINRINKVLEGINKGIYMPANEGSWWCHKNWCGYHSSCPFVKK